MQSYAIVRKRLIKAEGEWLIAPEPSPSDARTWTDDLGFVPGTVADVRKNVDTVKISFTADILPAECGAWAGMSDLEKIARDLPPYHRIKRKI